MRGVATKKVTPQLQSPLVAIPLEMLLEEEDEAHYLSPSSESGETPQRTSTPHTPVERKPLLLHESNAELNTIAAVIDSVRKRQLSSQAQPSPPADSLAASTNTATATTTPVWADRVKALRTGTRSLAVDEPAAPQIALSPATLQGLRVEAPAATSPVPMTYSPIQTPKGQLRHAYAQYADRVRSVSPVRLASPPKQHLSSRYSIYQPLPVSSPVARAQSYQSGGYGTSQLASYTLPPMIQSPSPPRSMVIRPEQQAVKVTTPSLGPLTQQQQGVVMWNRGTQMEPAEATGCEPRWHAGEVEVQTARDSVSTWTQCEETLIADSWTQCEAHLTANPNPIIPANKPPKPSSHWIQGGDRRRVDPVR